MKKTKINNSFFFSNDLDLRFILGPCQIESKSHAFDICSEINNLSAHNFVAPYKLIGDEALSVESDITFFTLHSYAALITFFEPIILVSINSVGFTPSSFC